jgi:hypothetical protein
VSIARCQVCPDSSRRQFHPWSLHVGVKDEKQPLDLDIGSLFAGIELVTKRPRCRILPLQRTQVRRKPCQIRRLIIVQVLAKEELSALDDGETTRERDSSPLLRDSTQASPSPDGALSEV